jgi:hypothetical protein
MFAGRRLEASAVADFAQSGTFWRRRCLLAWLYVEWKDDEMRNTALSLIVCALCIGTVCVAACAADGQQYTLRYAPAVDTADQGRVKVALLDLTYQGTPLGFTGAAQSVYKTRVTKVEGSVASVEIRLSDIKADLMGETYTPKPPDAVTVRMGARGTLVGIEPAGGGSFNPLGDQGLPLQALAMMSAAMQFPDKPVACGDTWELTEEYALPNMGQVKMKTSSALQSVDGALATIKSRIEIALPDINAPNPLVPEQQITYKNGKVVVDDLIRVYDMDASQLRRATGRVQMEFLAQFPDMPAPMGATGQLSLVSDAATAAEKPAS